MKILIPFEVPDECDFMTVYLEAFADQTNKIVEREYEIDDINKFNTYYESCAVAIDDKDF